MRLLTLFVLQTERLKMIEREVEELKKQLELNKREAHQAEEQYKETMHHWQTKVSSLFSKNLQKRKKYWKRLIITYYIVRRRTTTKPCVQRSPRKSRIGIKKRTKEDD